METYETELAEYKKIMNESKTNAEATEARRSFDLAPDKPTQGERMAAFDSQVTDAWHLHNKARSVVDLKQAQINMLTRIYFDCKNIIDNAQFKSGSNKWVKS